jgi:murein DD-endopeptidase MepM/ murein hydrolase activator NlpD
MTRLLRWFPERQIYHRSDGRVQFVVLSPRFQIISIVVGLACLSWVAYASVMTGFKNEIVAAKEERVRTLQTRYENELARMRLDYDDLSEKLALAEKRFDTTVAAVEKRQSDLQTAMVGQEAAGDALAEVMERAATVRALGLGPDATELPTEEDPGASGGVVKPEVPAAAAPDAAPAAKPTGQDKQASLSFDAPLPSPKPEHIQLASADASEPAPEPLDVAPAGPTDFTASGRNVPAGEGLTALEDRLDAVAGSQQMAAAGIAQAALDNENDLREILQIAGMDPNGIVPLPDSQGGPFIAMTDPLADPFARDPNLELADAALERVSSLKTAMLAIPFANPLPAVTRISSGFGGRRDPFSGGRAFHSGLDFKGAYGTPIIATAPGTVTVADWQGGYGRMVEIDHGYGLKTRYAHLSAINVAEGQKVGFGETVGALGNTGRSTGPHLHYEVWYGGQARNPWNFLKAGANVLQRQDS